MFSHLRPLATAVAIFAAIAASGGANAQVAAAETAPAPNFTIPIPTCNPWERICPPVCQPWEVTCPPVCGPWQWPCPPVCFPWQPTCPPVCPDFLITPDCGSWIIDSDGSIWSDFSLDSSIWSDFSWSWDSAIPSLPSVPTWDFEMNNGSTGFGFGL